MMTKVYKVLIAVDNPNVKRFNPTTNLCTGIPEQVSEFIHEIMFDYYTNVDGMKVQLTIKELTDA